MKYWLRLASVAAVGMALGGAADATLINVQFGGVSQETGAAVVGTSGDYWNQYGATASSPGGKSNLASTNLALLTSANVASGYSLSFSALGSYTLNSSFPTSNFSNLMRGYLISSANGSVSATISGLAAGQTFSLYLYSQRSSASSGFKSSLTVNGITQALANTNANGFIENNNYSIFNGVADANGQIVIQDTSAYNEIDLNGLQLITTAPAQNAAAVPESGTWAMMTGGFGLLGGSLRRRKRTARFA